MEKASIAKTRADDLPFCFKILEKIGTKETFKVPSAKRLRNKFGKRKATKKASAHIVAPKNQAINISRPKPIIRLSIVNPLTVAMECSNDILFLYSQSYLLSSII